MEYRQHTDAQWIRTVRVNNLGTKTINSATYTQESGPAGGTLTHGVASVTGNTVSALIGTADAAGEYQTLVLVTLDSGEVLDTVFNTEVYG